MSSRVRELEGWRAFVAEHAEVGEHSLVSTREFVSSTGGLERRVRGYSKVRELERS